MQQFLGLYLQKLSNQKSRSWALRLSRLVDQTLSLQFPRMEIRKAHGLLWRKVAVTACCSLSRLATTLFQVSNTPTRSGKQVSKVIISLSHWFGLVTYGWHIFFLRITVSVDNTKEMLGTFSPQSEPYSFEMPEDTTPSGIFARGSYSARSKVSQLPFCVSESLFFLKIFRVLFWYTIVRNICYMFTNFYILLHKYEKNERFSTFRFPNLFLFTFSMLKMKAKFLVHLHDLCGNCMFKL